MRRHTPLLKGLLLALSVLNTLHAAAAPISRDDPESADPGSKGISSASGSAVVVTANPLASEAALRILREGGTAVDALVTAQAVLAVVEPQSSGLAGGGFLLHWDAKQRSLEVLDGREVAPERSQPDDLLNPSGSPLPWREATAKANAIGIPGTEPPAAALLWFCPAFRCGPQPRFSGAVPARWPAPADGSTVPQQRPIPDPEAAGP